MWVLIGAPVYDRAWILKDYFKYIEQQDFPLRKLGFVFEAAPNDEETVQCLFDFAEKHPELKCFDVVINTQEDHLSHPEGLRRWNRDRYHAMARMRNNLLSRAIVRNPDRYLSLDTDIFLEDPTTITHLVQLTGALDAVAPLAYMGPEDIQFPNVMTWVPSGQAFRNHELYHLGQVFRADIIMAAVMMSPQVYQNAKYYWHSQGEDLGWARDCQQKDYELYCAANIYTPHIMSRAMLAGYQMRGDPRKDMLSEKLASLA